MRFLLVNKNPAVKKIFNITAKKANIELDEVDAVDKIPLDKDYSCIFIDDGIKKSGDVNNFKSKMATTKFCIILAKDSPLASGFDSYIRKPFLPTDIYEVLKKEKYSDMNTVKDESDSKGNINDDIDELSGADSIDEVPETDINANNDIDLSEFSDSEDEFLSGTKEPETAQGIDFSGSPLGSESGAIDFDIPEDSSQGLDSVDLSHLNSSADNADIPQDSSIDMGLDDSAIDTGAGDLDLGEVDSTAGAQSADLGADLDLGAGDLGADLAQDAILEPTPNPAVDSPSADTTPDIDLGDVPSANPSVSQLQESGIDLDLPNVNQSAPVDSQPTPADLPPAIEPQQDNLSQSADDIDFSQIMALQDEILEEEKTKNQKKSIIGGDIYTPKGEAKGAEPKPSAEAQTPKADYAPDIALDAQVAEPIADIAPQDLPQDLGADSIDLALDSPTPSTDSPSVDSQSADFADIAIDSPTPSVDLGADLGADSIALDTTPAPAPQDFTIDLAQDSQTPQVDSTPDSAPQDTIDLALDSPIPSADLPSADSQSNDFADIAQDLSNSQEPMKDAQGAEDDFLESLDFLKDPTPSVADSNFIDMSGDSTPPPSAPPPDLTQSAPPPDLTQDSAVSAPPPAPEPQATSAEPPKYEEYSFDSMANEEFDGLDGLSGISSIASDSPLELPPKPTNKGNNDILSNLEISPQDNITADYHADSPSVAQSAPLNQSEDALNHIDEQHFNTAFSSGISAEMDSISPNFKAQDFIQDLTLGSDTALPDFSKSLKQHTTAEQRYNMLGLPINEDGAVKDIQDLSKNELDSLDDEAILLLQENSLQNKSTPKATPKGESPVNSSPKILDKQQIDDITNILEGTQKPNTSAPSESQKPQKPSVSINNNEFGSLTQEALSEVLGEEISDDEFESSDDLMGATPNITSDSPKGANQSANPSKTPSIPSQINLGDGNMDIANILQTFPIDKLRELLSGVQITVNITFPTKKQ